MAPRKRMRKNREMPDNLYSYIRNGVTYYNYRHPVTKQYHGMGIIKAEAFAAARQLNNLLSRESDLVAQVMGTANQDINHLISRFKKEFLPTKKLADSTLENIGYRLDRIGRDIGDTLIDQVDVQFIANYLDENYQRDAYIKHRGQLVDLFRFAIMKGLYPSDWPNPAEITYAKTDYGKNRQRLSIEQFKAIHAAADPWMQNAMEIALVTLQGRAEVINMKFADYKNGSIRVIRQKTKKHEHARIQIHCPELENIISRARLSDIACPYIVHRRPDRRKPAVGREHWAQLTANDFSAKFREFRDSCKIFDNIPKNKRPTFHEIRALGSWLYKKQGFDNETYVQPLMAHADEKMTEGYQKGHQDEYLNVRAELNIKDIISR
ncbi:MAG: phage integrase Arm DNA-binding domain-containing protein [Marinobacter sp.]|nr:phage integrase Arm DNA-binding domain-containing protein [Marinobacter sp.]